MHCPPPPQDTHALAAYVVHGAGAAKAAGTTARCISVDLVLGAARVRLALGGPYGHAAGRAAACIGSSGSVKLEDLLPRAALIVEPERSVN
jgi:hypothetical protein